MDLDMVPLTHPSPHPKRHHDRFSRFCMDHGRDRPTDRQTDHATSFVAISCIYWYVVLRCGLMTVIITIKQFANVSEDEEALCALITFDLDIWHTISSWPYLGQV